MRIPPAYSPVRPLDILKALFAGDPAVANLEARLAEWYEADRALATGSGTQALQLAIRAALDSVGGRGIVALPAYNCFDMVSAAVWVGAPAIFYDIDPLTLAPDPRSLARTVARSDVLVVANLYGFPLDWNLIRDLADREGTPVVEDAAQGLGARWKEKEAGTFGDLSVLSFGRGKGWTGGSGGAVLARRGSAPFLPTKLKRDSASRVIQGAKLAAIWLFARPLAYGIPSRFPALKLGETPYHPPRDPTAISPFAASVVADARNASLVEVETRRKNGQHLRTAIRETGASDLGIELPYPLPGGETGDLRLPILSETRNLENPRVGIYRGYPRLLSNLDAIAGLVAEAEGNPGASRLQRSLITGPTHSRSRPEKIMLHASLFTPTSPGAERGRDPFHSKGGP